MKRKTLLITLLLIFIASIIYAGQGINEPKVVRDWAVKHNVFSYKACQLSMYKKGTTFDDFKCVIVEDLGNYFKAATAMDLNISNSGDVRGDVWRDFVLIKYDKDFDLFENSFTSLKVKFVGFKNNLPLFKLISVNGVEEEAKQALIMGLLGAAMIEPISYFFNTEYGNYWYTGELKKDTLDAWESQHKE